MLEILNIALSIAAVVICLVLMRKIGLALFHGGFGPDTHAGYHYRRRPDNLDHLTDTEFFGPRQPPEVYYGLGPDPYEPNPKRKK